MNIFFLHEQAHIAAQMHCDKHVVKMILETAQVLSTNFRLAGKDIGYQITHRNHPAVKWARDTTHNTLWLASLGLHLVAEYMHRYDKIHACRDLISNLWSLACFQYNDAPDILTPPALCMPPQFQSEAYDIYRAVGCYRAYYLGAKQHLLKYTRREIPEWIKDMGLGVQK